MVNKKTLFVIGILATLLSGVAVYASYAIIANSSEPLSDDMTTQHITGDNNELISYPVSIPTQPEVTLLTFTQADLPSFSMQYPDDWDVEIKEFFEEDSKNFVSHYYAYYDSDISACADACMGVRFKNGDAVLNLTFDLILDDGGTICSDSAELSKLNDIWYRIKAEEEYYYSQNIVENELVDHPEWRYTVDGETEAGKDKTYKFCDHLSGNTLVEKPTGSIATGEAILMEKPRVSGIIDDHALSIIDQMILSIEGITGMDN